MTRKYTKKNCNYWGHDASYVHTAIDQDTKKIIAYYGVCKRCSGKIFISTKGGLDNAALRHLAAITLENLPTLIMNDNMVDFKICDVFKKANYR